MCPFVCDLALAESFFLTICYVRFEKKPRRRAEIIVNSTFVFGTGN